MISEEEEALQRELEALTPERLLLLAEELEARLREQRDRYERRHRYLYGAPTYPHIFHRVYPDGRRPPPRYDPDDEQYPIVCTECGKPWSKKQIAKNCPQRVSRTEIWA